MTLAIWPGLDGRGIGGWLQGLNRLPGQGRARVFLVQTMPSVLDTQVTSGHSLVAL